MKLASPFLHASTVEEQTAELKIGSLTVPVEAARPIVFSRELTAYN
jgi:hypothetical protein